MSDNRITKYYLLCTVRNGTKKLLVNSINRKDLNIVFTKREMHMWFRERDGNFMARELVVGGNDLSHKHEILVIH